MTYVEWLTELADKRTPHPSYYSKDRNRVAYQKWFDAMPERARKCLEEILNNKTLADGPAKPLLVRGEWHQDMDSILKIKFGSLLEFSQASSGIAGSEGGMLPAEKRLLVVLSKWYA